MIHLYQFSLIYIIKTAHYHYIIITLKKKKKNNVHSFWLNKKIKNAIKKKQNYTNIL